MQFTEKSIIKNNQWHTLAIILFLVYWLLSILTQLYFHSFKNQHKPKKSWFLSSEKLSPDEIYWTNKIYGIYNDYVFILPKPENYLGEEKEKLSQFTKEFENIAQTKSNNFPQNKAIIIGGVRVPQKFEYKTFENESDIATESFRWIYSIPLSFYKNLHKQVKCLFITAFILLLAISMIPANHNILETLGAPGLLCGSFACWISIYTGVLYVDYALLRKSWFSLRLFLLILLSLSSYFNNDHPVRFNNSTEKPRIVFKTHLENWFKEYKRTMDNNSASTNKHKGMYPVVFICAEGGALRTGAYTAIFLDELQRELYKRKIDFKRSVYAMSGVSGGSLGLGYYNAATYINKASDFKTEFKADSTAVETFFMHDFLSPVIGKMFYSDLLNLFIPVHFNRFDRAIALEESWEYAYKHILKKNMPNTFANNFLAFYNDKDKKPAPLFLINTTEVETGNQCWVSNVVPGPIIFGKQRDLLGEKIHYGINYSTAINFSSRFPLLSPGGMLLQKDSSHTWKLHYVDGGYYENTGAGSMYELLTEIKRDTAVSKHIYPIVIYLRFSEDPANQTKNINFGNEISEVVSGIYDTRNGRTYMAVQQLNQLAINFQDKDSTGVYIDEPLSEDQRQVPMNWVLSRQSMDNIKADVNYKLHDKSPKGALTIINKCMGDYFPKVKVIK